MKKPSFIIVILRDGADRRGRRASAGYAIARRGQIGMSQRQKLFFALQRYATAVPSCPQDTPESCFIAAA